MEEHSLIKELKEGENDSFKYIYEKYREKLFTYVFCKIKNKCEAEDLVQEVFTKVYRNIGLYDEKQGTFYNFLLTNANQVIAEYSRKHISREQKAERIHLDYDIASDDKMFAVYDKFDGEYNIEGILDELPEDQREVFILVCIKNMSYKDAERILQKSELSIKSLLYRARRNLKRKINERYPEIAKEYGFKKALKMIVISCICIGTIGGFTYATWRAYQNNIYKSNFTIADTKQDIKEENENSISKDLANEKINEYLQILGVSTTVNIDNIHLLKDYKSDVICWEYKNDNFILKINASDGKFVRFSTLGKELKINNYSENILGKLDLINGYEVTSNKITEGNVTIEYERKYGEIFNKYQSITVIVKNEKIFSITTSDCKYEDKEINVSKEEALKILKDNGINANDVELAIENVGILNNEKQEKVDETISYENSDENILKRKQLDVRKVWKTDVINGKKYYIDVNTKEIISINDEFIEKGTYKK